MAVMRKFFLGFGLMAIPDDSLECGKQINNFFYYISNIVREPAITDMATLR
jgi:hypothetical protein